MPSRLKFAGFALAPLSAGIATLALCQPVFPHSTSVRLTVPLKSRLVSLAEQPNALTAEAHPRHPIFAQTSTNWNRKTIVDQLNQEGSQFREKSRYQDALAKFRQALIISRETGNRIGESVTLTNIGLVYDSLGKYPEALKFLRQALIITREVGDRTQEGATLNVIGAVYNSLGQYFKALEAYQQGLSIRQEVNDRPGVGNSLNNIGLVYNLLEQYPKALEAYQKALTIRREVGDRAGEGATLNGIGGVYRNLGQYPKSLKAYEQALAIRREVGDRAGEGATLNGIGRVYSELKQYSQALEAYHQALRIRQEIGNRAGESSTLSNIGSALQAQEKSELAIIFFKQSIAITEMIRRDLRMLPKAQQITYTQTVAFTYRRLAGILLQQNRVLEAQQVLDLLKVQELDDYLRNVRGVGQQIEFLRPEMEILKRYGKLQETAIRVGQELAELRKKAAQGALTEVEKQRVAELDRLETSLNEQFGQFIRSDEVKKLVAQLSPEVQEQIVKLSDLEALRDDLRRMNAVMIYPLVLSDRLELIITTPDTIPLRRTVPIKRETLNAAILEFRRALQSPGTDAKPIAQKLYSWLIQPLEADLKQATPQTIIYAPDGQLRYIPLAALHDGQKWLVQRYRINNITAKSLTKFNNPSQVQMRVLAGAFADAATTYPVKVGERNFNFKGLPFAGQEVTNLAALFPGTNKVLDRAFSLASVKPMMNGFSVVHLATHAAFVPGDPSNSFILFGDGSFATLRDIENWSLNNVDLVVLSACETGVGIKDVGDRALGNGEEVLGLGYQFQNRGARATIASLWSVDDGGTEALMSAFYTALKQKDMTKAEALRQAQIFMITGKAQNSGTGQPRTSVNYNPGQNQKATISRDSSHPYYWAPFILIGNGL